MLPVKKNSKESNPQTKDILLIVAAMTLGGIFSYTYFQKYYYNKKPIRIYLDGCWDVMHSGHYNAIRQAKMLGDILIVGVHSDEEIAYHKRLPVMNNEERLAAVKACKWVDEIVFDVPYSPTNALLDRDDIKADFVAHGDDIPYDADGRSCYEEVMHRLKTFKRTPGVSTTMLINRLLAASKYIKDFDNEIDDSNIDENSNTEFHENENVESKDNRCETWCQFLPTSHRVGAFSNNRAPKANDKIVYIDGDFDLFHVGHISALKEAKAKGTYLYVGVFDDITIQKHKSVHFPLMSLQERILNVLSCRYVDEVIIGSPFEITKEMISTLNIHLVVNSSTTSFVSKDETRFNIPKQMNIYEHIIPKDSSITTNALIHRLVKDHKLYEEQNQKRIQRELKYHNEKKYVPES